MTDDDAARLLAVIAAGAFPLRDAIGKNALDDGGRRAVCAIG